MLGLLQKPYACHPPDGQWFRQRWGTCAILDDPVANRGNIVSLPGLIFGWVGELIFPGGIQSLQRCLEASPVPAPDDSEGSEVDRLTEWLGQGSILQNLNGAFAAFLITDRVACVITDPMATVQVYSASDDQGRPIAVGTHADIVARCLDQEDRIDPVSVCDFLNKGTPCCPHTMHRNVVELHAGTAHVTGPSCDGNDEQKELRYWLPPPEMQGELDEQELAEEFARLWHTAVAARCEGNRLGVLLSGGLDSRLLLASVPAEKECVGLTVCDSINREAWIANRVAACYNRGWLPLQRDPDYLLHTAPDAIRFTGCEGEWHHAHFLGFRDQIAGSVDSVFTGLFMDNNFKGYYARDLVRNTRMAGLLPARYSVEPLNYCDAVSPFCRQSVRKQIVDGCIERRRQFSEHHFAAERSSPWEWLDGYPLSQSSDNTTWSAERRVMPIRLPVMDRALVDLAFRIPIEIKAGGSFMRHISTLILKNGCNIPNANDGVKPCSGHVPRLLQRARRKLETHGRWLLARLGLPLAVPHSWHDYEAYWTGSEALHRLLAQHSHNMEVWAGEVLHTSGADLLARDGLPWQVGLRLLQLAVWQSVIKEYKLESA